MVDNLNEGNPPKPSPILTNSKPKKEERPHILEALKRVEAGVRLRDENDKLKAEIETLRHVLDETLWCVIISRVEVIRM